MPETNSDMEATVENGELMESLSPEEIQKVTSQSEPYIGQWNNLISTTNWEKGEIICTWRAKLRDEGGSSSSWSDEQWSQMVGGVTPQHVGRLRRTFERFGHVYQEFKGIYWSHFYAALDWDDAEMWLEGSVQNNWSVSQMRKQRWETMGKVTDRPNPADIVVVESAEETQSLAIAEPGTKEKGGGDYPDGPNFDEGPDFGDEPTGGKSSNSLSEDPAQAESESEATATPKSNSVRPFEAFTDLPKDVAEAADMFKIAIIRHRADEWVDISKEDMMGLLDAMKQLVEAE